MKTGFYMGLAKEGIKKNRRMYLPYLLTCTGMVMMYYILLFLQTSEVVSKMRGGNNLQFVLSFGGWVMAVFSCIFLFYTNSFLIRRRKKEFGLYNILGMGRRHIGIILFWENLFLLGISLSAGLFLGILFSKIAELLLCNLLQSEIVFQWTISIKSIRMTILIFCLVFLLLYINGLRQIHFSSTIALLSSDKKGEKVPKANWLMGILGFLILFSAYGIAVSIKEPLAAFSLFFFAVIFVIIGTFLLMISGSVLLCRILQKNRTYYYKANHFVSISSMAYRMKQNGAGLASICILSTMVLVILSSTSSLYFGCEDALNQRYKREIVMEFTMKKAADVSEKNVGELSEKIEQTVKSLSIEPENVLRYSYASIFGMLSEDTIEVDSEAVEANQMLNMNHIVMINFLTLSDYNRIMGTKETLKEGEAIFCSSEVKFDFPEFHFRNGPSYKIKEIRTDNLWLGNHSLDVVPSILLVVPDLETSLKGLYEKKDANGNKMVIFGAEYDFDTGIAGKKQVAFYQSLKSAFDIEEPGTGCRIRSKEFDRSDYFLTFGGLFYLGILLSIVFLLATVLIIYYKQISEGYEDQKRFEIMQKVGMTKKEIRKSVNSQLLLVFFFPLLLAGIHISFAFPMIRKLLFLFGLDNAVLFAITCLISFVVFGLFYVFVYRMTSNAYYSIVSKGVRE